ncbi:hypothetical protein Are01nite_82500 [Actinoplanes regularis]|nr:hypothetical protein Are01nite_82500 [Actinoplanes regularis]
MPGMAEKGWTTQAGAAAGIAAGAGAAQLGLGYGLGVIEWPAVATASDSTWLNSLGWATWVTASATVLGAVIAGRMRTDQPGPWRTLWRIALSAASALGALVSVALVALPARSVVLPVGVTGHSPQLVAVGYALIGLVTGLAVAFWAVSSAPVAANLLGTAAWLWALAIAGVAAELASGRELETYLTSWQFAETQSPIRHGGIYWPSAILTLAAAFVIGLVLAWPAARRGDRGLGTATSGAVGPLLVAISFIALAPLFTEPAGPLQSAYLIAPYAVLAGLAGSALTVSLTRGPGRPSPSPTDPPLSLPAGPTRAEVPDVAAGSTKPTTRVAPKPTPPPAPKVATKAEPAAKGEPAPASPAEKPGRRRWLLFGERRPAGTGQENPGEQATPEPKGRTRKPRASKPAESPAPRTPAPAKPAEDDGLADPELAAAARPSKNATKRAAARKDAATRPTITPPPVNPPVARINPKD